MTTPQNRLTSILFCFFVIISIQSCKKEDDELQVPSADISGNWIWIEKVVQNCQYMPFPDFSIEMISVQQNNNVFTADFVDKNTDGTGDISGDRVRCNTTYTFEDNPVAFYFTGYLPEDTTWIEGEAVWNVTLENLTCSGTSSVTAIRKESPSIDASGSWTGTWSSSLGQGELTFEIIQNGELLSGSFVIPDLVSTTAVDGMVSGHSVLFGDTETEKAYFIGIVNGLSASGTFYDLAPGRNVIGTWQAVKNGSVQSRHAYITDSITLPVDSLWSGDFIITKSRISKSGITYIYNYNLSAETLDSIRSPFTGGNPMAFDGNNLILFSESGDYGKTFAYKLNPDRYSIIKIPVKNDIRGLTFDGTDFWIKEYTSYNDIQIHQVDLSGHLIKSIPCNNFAENFGLTFDGTHFWYPEYNALRRCDQDGVVVSSLSYPTKTPINGLTYDGTNLWFGYNDASVISRSNMSGTILNEITAPGNHSKGMTWDGSNLWYLYGATAEAKLAKLNPAGNVVLEKDVSYLQPSAVAFNGEYLYLADNANKYLYAFNTDLNNFYSVELEHIVHLSYENSNLWAIYGDDNEIISKINNNTGEVIKSFGGPVEDLAGIAGDESHLWVVVGGASPRIYNLNQGQGAVKDIYFSDSRLSQVTSLAFDGDNLWCFVIKDLVKGTGVFYKIELSE